jgi:ubiquitin-conjugating enzyme E2 D/E
MVDEGCVVNKAFREIQQSVRLTKEREQLIADPPAGIAAQPSNAELSEWDGALVGPEGTPYCGGVFYFKISCPPEYPLKAPTIKFQTKIYHCNIGADGSVCHEVLRDKWSPVLTLSHALISVMSLLKNPNLGFAGVDGYVSFDRDASYSVDIAEQFKKDRAKHDCTAAEWTQKHAMGGLTVIPQAAATAFMSERGMEPPSPPGPPPR